MTGNNKKVWRKRSEKEKAKVSSDPSSACEDDEVSKLNDLNQIIVKDITGLREEKPILTTNLSEMVLEIESARKLTEEWNEAEKKLREDLRKNDAEYQANLLSRLAELQTNLELMASEKGSPSETKRGLRTEAQSLKAQLVSEIEYARKMAEEWKEFQKELRKELVKEHGEYQAVISQAGKQLQEAEEIFNTKISAKEMECRAVNLEKRSLEATVLQLKNQIQVISAELEATSKDAKLERNVLLSQIVAAKTETAKITKRNQMAEEAWNAEKENRLSRLSELQTNLLLMASDKGPLSETNSELRTEAESLKAQLIDYNDKLVSMEDERQALLQQNATMEKEITILQERLNENVKQHADEIQQYKVEENSVKEQNQMLEREVRSTQCLLEIRNKSIHERILENGKLRNQVEGLSKAIVGLQEIYVKLVQEKDEQRREFESLHADAVKKYKFMEEKHSELFKEKEEQVKPINSLRGEINYLKEATKKNEDFAEKCSESQHSTIAQEEESALVDNLNYIYVRNLANIACSAMQSQNRGMWIESEVQAMPMKSQNQTS